MDPHLPPPDPNESFGRDTAMHLPAPAAIFMAGAPSPEADRLSDAILALRPGALFVAVHD